MFYLGFFVDIFGFLKQTAQKLPCCFLLTKVAEMLFLHVDNILNLNHLCDIIVHNYAITKDSINVSID